MKNMVRMLIVSGLLAAALQAQPFGEVPVLDFRLPWFNERTGQKSAELQGKEGRWFQNDSRIEISVLNLKVFDARDPSIVEAEISSPLAIVRPHERTVSGPGQLRVEGRSYELFGDNWTYYHDTRTVVIREDVVATLRFDIGNVLDLE